MQFREAHESDDEPGDNAERTAGFCYMTIKARLRN